MRRHLPLNALRAFEASARLLSFTRAGMELRVTQTAISHQVKQLEDLLGASLFRRLPRGLALTEEARTALLSMADGDGRASLTLAEEVWRAALIVAFQARSPF